MNTIERIENEMAKKNVKKKDVAKAIGLSDSCFGSWKRGRSESYRKYLPEIAALLGCTADYLATGEKPKFDPIQAAYEQADEYIKKAIRILLRIEG